MLITDQHTYAIDSLSKPEEVESTTPTSTTTTSTTTKTTTTKPPSAARNLLDIDPSVLDAYAESQKWRRYVAPTVLTTPPPASLTPPPWIRSVGQWAQELAPLGKVALELGQHAVLNSPQTLPTDDIIIPGFVPINNAVQRSVAEVPTPPVYENFGHFDESDYGQPAEDIFGAGELEHLNDDELRALLAEDLLPTLPFDTIDQPVQLSQRVARPVSSGFWCL